MSFHVGIGSLGGTVFFHLELCTPQWTMDWSGDCLEREDSLLWHEVFIKKTKILTCSPVCINFQNHFF